MSPSVGLCAQLACIWEATARKPGNVHRFRDFHDTSYLDFLVSAAAIAPVLDTAVTRPVGATILEAVRATRAVTATNTNLGIILLLAPLAAVPPGIDLKSGVREVLLASTVEDARLAYEAIRRAQPAGLGEVAEQDIRNEPTQTLREVMDLAKDRDLVARQYARGYVEVIDYGARTLELAIDTFQSLEDSIIATQLTLLSVFPDSLIARKHGLSEAQEVQRRAKQASDRWYENVSIRTALVVFDAWLCEAGHGRNPGTTADLVAASLFAALREGLIELPPKIPWSAEEACQVFACPPEGPR